MNPGAEIRKPLRAKKTMALSSRKQMELLNKLKTVQGAERTAGEEKPVCLPAAEANGLPHSSQDEPSCQTGTRQKPLLAKEPVASVAANSETSIYGHRGETLKDLSSPDVKRFLNAGALQDMLCRWYEKESGSPSWTPVEVRSELEPAGPLPDWLLLASSTNRIAAVDAVAETAGETPACPAIPVLQQEESHFQVPKRQDAPATPPGDVQSKRAAPNGDEDVLSKRIKTSSEPVEGGNASLDKVQSGLGKLA